MAAIGDDRGSLPISTIDDEDDDIIEVHAGMVPPGLRSRSSRSRSHRSSSTRRHSRDVMETFLRPRHAATSIGSTGTGTGTAAGTASASASAAAAAAGLTSSSQSSHHRLRSQLSPSQQQLLDEDEVVAATGTANSSSSSSSIAATHARRRERAERIRERRLREMHHFHHFQHHHHHHHVHLPQAQSAQHQQQQQQRQTSSVAAEPAIIDLTEEPDSPIEAREPSQSIPPFSQQSATSTGRNPRRTNSQRSTPPRLARSDSTFMGMATFIDLTDDSPDFDRPPSEPHRANTRAQSGTHGGNQPRPPPPPRMFPHSFGSSFLPTAQPIPRQQQGRDEVISLEFVRGGTNFAHNFGRRLAGIAGILGASGPFGGGFRAPELDVTRTPFAVQRPPSPKPAMEPIPPARSGFTRETCAEPEEGQERVVICPACKDELAYDPVGSGDGGQNSSRTTTTSGGRKRKRAPGEHHFWALKKCGHVYCADCFENRKPTKTAPIGVGFPGPGGVLPSSSPNDVRCAVDDCETKVVQKSEWVGIFL